ncbi:SOS response-associated peptidase [Flavisolibacter ginsenosidimutans]|uniref:Abasic site processing protein n=1 Tax=Flavisolibacter ginsenosidimutans TaxID=661481 RepID=A0A5B8UN80_9BACT|nr:SOS response-associated peptidase family protein [Flavisolibacter ginsenosidimutans]QEC57540.1 SOS response-associated peptidase [Flavisolibacter ginsenosidimutans]
MCYDISFAARFDKIIRDIPGIEVDPSLRRDEDMLLHVQAQAHRKYPVVIFENANYKLKPFEWGVIAEYMNTPEKQKKMRSQMCNARSEKIVEDRKSYWHRLRKTRCLIPATGIYEHREVSGFKNKIPYHVSLKGREQFYIPGLYHYPHKADVETGEITGTFTLVTRPANRVMAQIHNSGDQAFRMPLFLTEELETKWLLPDLSDEEMSEVLDFEMPSEELDYRPVYTVRTTKERPDGKTKVDAYEWPDLPPLGNANVPPQAELF